jgi:hypothetical protein
MIEIRGLSQISFVNPLALISQVFDNRAKTSIGEAILAGTLAKVRFITSPAI